MEMKKIENKKVDEELMMKKRREDLDRLPHGKEVDFDEAVAYQKSLPDSKVWWKMMKKLEEEGRMSVFPRAGINRKTSDWPAVFNCERGTQFKRFSCCTD